MSENKELDAALLNLETRHRVESFLIGLGASEEAAKLIASSPEQAAKFKYDGVNLLFGKGDLPAVDDPAARSHFIEGPFKGLFVPPKADTDDKPQLDEALVASARAGNKTAYSRLARDSFGGDVKALDAVLAGKGNGDDKGAANGHDKSNLNGHDGSNNPFFKLRKVDGTIDKKVEADIGRMIKAMGHRKVSDIARAAKSPAAPLGLSLTGLPLKP
jgi:hypothetical protein